MKRGEGKRERTQREAHKQSRQGKAEQHMGGAFSLSLLLLAPMYQIPALETHKPAQLPTSTPRLSFISPFSLFPSFPALISPRLTCSNLLVVVLLPFVATTDMFPDSIHTPALATTTTLLSPVCWGGRVAHLDDQRVHI